ncbi:MAG: hypothetical protein GY853_07230 [PVC group bacterium]|nr:hypothetical protein [PVC group bacterium]
MNNNNLFIQRRFQVQKDSGSVHFMGSIYIAYYFYLNSELYVSKYALCIKFTKKESELKQLMS